VINAQDKTLTCRECNQEFTFTASEQDFYAQKGFTNNPSRCPACRANRKSQRSEGGYGSRSGGGFNGREREMYAAVCAQCGKETTVPFQPRGDRPVYCSECYTAQRQSYGGDRSSGGGGRRSY
jgi:CxxC-x17-CxxC domain-containing protein